MPLGGDAYGGNMSGLQVAVAELKIVNSSNFLGYYLGIADGITFSPKAFPAQQCRFFSWARSCRNRSPDASGRLNSPLLSSGTVRTWRRITLSSGNQVMTYQWFKDGAALSDDGTHI
jgi:hypothetical protein